MHKKQISECQSNIRQVTEKLSSLEREKSRLEERKNQIIKEVDNLQQKFYSLTSQSNSQLNMMQNMVDVNKNNISGTKNQGSRMQSIKIGTSGINDIIDGFQKEIDFFNNEKHTLSKNTKNKTARFEEILKQLNIQKKGLNENLDKINSQSDNLSIKAPCKRCGCIDYTYIQKCNNNHYFCNNCADFSLLGESECPDCGGSGFNTDYEKGSALKDPCPKCNRNDYYTLKHCNNNHRFCNKCSIWGCPFCSSSVFNSGSGIRNPEKKPCDYCNRTDYSFLKICPSGHEYCSICAKYGFPNDILCAVCGR